MKLPINQCITKGREYPLDSTMKPLSKQLTAPTMYSVASQIRRQPKDNKLPRAPNYGERVVAGDN